MDKNEEALNYFLEFDMVEYGIKYLGYKKKIWLFLLILLTLSFQDTHEARDRFLDDEEYLDIILKLFESF